MLHQQELQLLQGYMNNKEDKVANSNMPYRNLTSKEYINKLKNGLI